MSEAVQLTGRADRLAREGDLRQAEELYRRVLAIDAGNTAALHALGRLCFRSGRAVEAVACYRRCLDRESANARRVGSGVDRSPALRRPLHDLEFKFSGICNQLTITP